MTLEIRRLRPGGEDVVRALATDEPQTALFADERTIFPAAFDRDPGDVMWDFEWSAVR